MFRRVVRGPGLWSGRRRNLPAGTTSRSAIGRYWKVTDKGVVPPRRVQDSNGRARMPLQKRTVIDGLIVVAFPTIAYLVARTVDLFEVFHRLTRTDKIGPLKMGQLDELLLAIAAAGVGLAWMCLRRWREAQREVLRGAKAQHALNQTEAKYRRLVESLRGEYFFYRHNTEGVFEYLSPSITDILGYTVEEFCKHYTVYLTDDPVNKEVQRHTELSIKGIQQPPYRVQVYHRNGTRRDLEVVEVPVFDENGKVVAVEGLAHDITRQVRAERQLRRYQEQLEQLVDERTEALNERNRQLVLEIAERERTEQSLRESEANLRAILQALPDMIFVLDPDGKILDYQGDSSQPFRPPSEMVGKHLHELVPPTTADKLVAGLRRALGSNQPVLLNYEVEKDGRKLYREARVAAIDQERLLAVVRDITEQRQAQYQLILTQFAADHMDEPIFWTDENARFIYVNEAACRTLGYSRDELLNMGVYDIDVAFPRDGWDHHWEELRRRGSCTLESVHRRKDGSTFPVEIRANYIEFERRGINCAFVRDVTQRKRAEQELMKAEKLESLSLLTGGIAHDFNNLLTAVMGNISVARTLPNLDPEAQRALDDAEAATLRAKDLTRQLLTFSKDGEPVKAPADIGALVRDAVSFALHGTTVRAELSLADDLAAAEVDASQISRVVHNLVLNAVQAMPDGGEVGVSAANEEMPEDNPFGLPSGPYVRIAVRDSGEGIPPEVQERIFDPYFTTKANGSGLGLAVSYSIVRKHGGAITVDSEPGKGSTFTFYLPASRKPLERRGDGERGRLPTGSGRILVLDDEEFIRRLTCRMLERLGYEPVAVSDGESAVREYRRSLETGQRFVLTILDLTIAGGQGGIETLAALRELDPQVRALLCSGYGGDQALRDFQEYGFNGLLPKPFRLAELARAVADALSAPVQAAARVGRE